MRNTAEFDSSRLLLDRSTVPSLNMEFERWRKVVGWNCRLPIFVWRGEEIEISLEELQTLITAIHEKCWVDQCPIDGQHQPPPEIGEVFLARIKNEKLRNICLGFNNGMKKIKLYPGVEYILGIS